MKKLRKNLLYITGVINFIITALLVLMAIALITNLDGVIETLSQEYAEIITAYDITMSELINVSKIYFSISALVHAVSGYFFIKCSRLSFENYYAKISQVRLNVLLNIVFNVFFINIILELVILFIPLSNNELKQANASTVTKHQELVFSSVVKTDDNLFLLSNQINKLKQQYSKNHITKDEYEAKLKEIFSSTIK